MTYVMNAITNALWFYENYPFNAFCEFDGKYYGTCDVGLCQIEVGDLDLTAPIPASLSFGSTPLGGDFDLAGVPLGNAPQSRVSDLYVSAQLDNKMVMTLTTDRSQSHSYDVLPRQTKKMENHRAPLGKGLRGKYWNIGLSNVAGGDFSFDSIVIDVAPTDRRI